MTGQHKNQRHEKKPTHADTPEDKNFRNKNLLQGKKTKDSDKEIESGAEQGNSRRNGKAY